MNIRTSTLVGSIALLCAGTWLIPSAALSSTKCLCNNGEVVQSMEDMDNPEDATVCNDACDLFGGGQVWNPRLDEYNESDEVNVHRPEREHPAEPAHRR